MKMRPILALALTAGFSLLAAGCQHANSTGESARGTAYTGSYIPQQAKPEGGNVTVGSSNLRVLDQKDMQTSGADNIPQMLRKKGAVP